MAASSNPLSAALSADGIQGVPRERKTIETDNLYIGGHLLRLNEVVIQISNISSVTAEKVPVPPAPSWKPLGWFLILIGTLSTGLGMALSSASSRYYGGLDEISQVSLVAGIIALVMGFFMAVSGSGNNDKVSEKMYLNFLTNSGRTYSILFKDEDFLYRVLQFFAYKFDHIEEDMSQFMMIDVKGKDITKVEFTNVYGDSYVVSNTQNSTIGRDNIVST